MTGFATVMLFALPILAVVLVFFKDRVMALIFVTVVGYLFLPDSFGYDLPGLPSYDKRTAIAVALTIMAFIFFLQPKQQPLPGSVHTENRIMGRLLVAMAAILLIGNVFTILDNRFVIITGPNVRNAMSPRDFVSMSVDVVVLLIPYFVARRWLVTPEHHSRLLYVIVCVGLLYTLLVLFEIRMSPQLNRWVYGYFPHHWVQHLRGNGFRPVVFLSHGLDVGLYLFMITVGAFALYRYTDKEKKAFALFSGIWSLLVLLASYNLGAALLALICIPVVLFLTPRRQVTFAITIAVAFLAYPILRQAELLPYTSFTNAVASYSPQRAASLQFRLDNESELLARALEKPLFGWGGWARNLIYDEQGRLQSVTDGLWIIIIGQRGWIGYMAFFGIICLPFFLLGRVGKRAEISHVTAGLAVIGAGNLIYLVPNATLSPVNWLIFGAIAGFVQSGASQTHTVPVEAGPKSRSSKYSRFGSGGLSPSPSAARSAHHEHSYRRDRKELVSKRASRVTRE